MANEHTIVIQKTFPISMIVADTPGFNRGTVLTSVDPFTASGSTAADRAIIAGIAYTEKIASDGNTQIAVLRGPGDILRATASGSIANGDPLAVEGDTANCLINLSDLAVSGAKRIGFALETATNGQTFLYELNIGDHQSAGP